MPLILFNKPYGVISQFSPHEKHPSLKEFIKEENVYPAGRLDHDSEGLLILTDEGPVQNLLANPKYKLAKTYWVQVDGEISDQAIEQLKKGLELKDGKTLPARARKINPPKIWQRDPPIRYRESIPTSWLELSIKEGKNRQVRRMTAATGFPTLRLIRVSIGEFTIDGLLPGEWRKIETPKFIKDQLTEVKQHANKLLGTTRHGGGHRRTGKKIPSGRRRR